MKKKQLQDEKLFGHEDLRKLIKKFDDIELMEKVERNYGLNKIFNNSNYEKTKGAIKKLIGR